MLGEAQGSSGSRRRVVGALWAGAILVAWAGVVPQAVLVAC